MELTSYVTSVFGTQIPLYSNTMIVGSSDEDIVIENSIVEKSPLCIIGRNVTINHVVMTQSHLVVLATETIQALGAILYGAMGCCMSAPVLRLSEIRIIIGKKRPLYVESEEEGIKTEIDERDEKQMNILKTTKENLALYHETRIHPFVSSKDNILITSEDLKARISQQSKVDPIVKTKN